MAKREPPPGPRFSRLKRKTVFSGRGFDVQSETWRDGSGKTFARESVVHPGAVAILPFAAADRLVMIRQFRMPVGEWIWEIPAGTLEPGETPLRCAKRELVEEVCFAARRWKKLGTIFTTPGFCTEVMHIYRAWDLSPAQGEADADEYIRIREMPLQEVLDAARTGRLRDAKSLAALCLERVAR